MTKTATDTRPVHTFQVRRVFATTWNIVFRMNGGDEQRTGAIVSETVFERRMALIDAADFLELVRVETEVVEDFEPVRPDQYESLLERAGALDIRIVPEVVS